MAGTRASQAVNQATAGGREIQKGTQPWWYSSALNASFADLTELPEPEDAQRAFRASDSPCVAVCSTLFDDICRGCGRTAMEVANWVFMTEEEKREVWIRIKAQGYPRRNN